jgi:hypothetical protein
MQIQYYQKINSVIKRSFIEREISLMMIFDRHRKQNDDDRAGNEREIQPL